MQIETSIFRSISFFTMLLLCAIFAAGSATDAALTPSQERPTTWRVNVDLVQVQVVVLDNKGKPLAGLRKDDFRIFQDDKEQQISAFDVVGGETYKASLPSSLSDINEGSQRGTAEGNLLIPDFKPGALTASSLIISQEMAPLPGLIKEVNPRMLSQIDPPQFKGFQVYAPVDVEIDRQRPFAVYYRIYAAPGSNAARPLKAKVQAVDQKGESHPFPGIDLASSALPVSQTETAIGFTLPCRDLKPGKYRLIVETVEAESGQAVISEADFQVR